MRNIAITMRVAPQMSHNRRERCRVPAIVMSARMRVLGGATEPKARTLERFAFAPPKGVRWRQADFAESNASAQHRLRRQHVRVRHCLRRLNAGFVGVLTFCRGIICGMMRFIAAFHSVLRIIFELGRTAFVIWRIFLVFAGFCVRFPDIF